MAVQPSNLTEFIAKKRGEEFTPADPERATQPNGKIAVSHNLPALPPDRCAELVRRILYSKKANAVDELGRTAFEQVVKAMIDTAVNPRSPMCVSAANFLFDRAFGKAKPSEAELGAMKEGGARFVLVQTQDIKPAKQKSLEAPKPEFMDAEVVENG